MDSSRSNSTNRVLARFGKILEAPAVPESREDLRTAGVLLAVPAILDLGILDTAKAVHRSLKPGNCGLRSLVLTLLFRAMFRIRLHFFPRFSSWSI